MRFKLFLELLSTDGKRKEKNAYPKYVGHLDDWF